MFIEFWYVVDSVRKDWVRKGPFARVMEDMETAYIVGFPEWREDSSCNHGKTIGVKNAENLWYVDGYRYNRWYIMPDLPTDTAPKKPKRQTILLEKNHGGSPAV